MFSNYQPDAKPLVNPGVVEIIQTADPYIDYDKCGNILQLSWGARSRFELDIPLTIRFAAPEGSLILSDAGDIPTEDSTACVAFNIPDRKCWWKVSGVWQEQENKLLAGTSKTALEWGYKDWEASLELEDFRRNVVRTIKGNKLIVDDAFAAEVVPGAYTLRCIVKKEETVFCLRNITVTIDEEGLLNRQSSFII